MRADLCGKKINTTRPTCKLVGNTKLSCSMDKTRCPGAGHQSHEFHRRVGCSHWRLQTLFNFSAARKAQCVDKNCLECQELTTLQTRASRAALGHSRHSRHPGVFGSPRPEACAPQQTIRHDHRGSAVSPQRSSAAQSAMATSSRSGRSAFSTAPRGVGHRYCDSDARA
jgi:hypothetical protein